MLLPGPWTSTPQLQLPLYTLQKVKTIHKELLKRASNPTKVLWNVDHPDWGTFTTYEVTKATTEQLHGEPDLLAPENQALFDSTPELQHPEFLSKITDVAPEYQLLAAVNACTAQLYAKEECDNTQATTDQQQAISSPRRDQPGRLKRTETSAGAISLQAIEAPVTAAAESLLQLSGIFLGPKAQPPVPAQSLPSTAKKPGTLLAWTKTQADSTQSSIDYNKIYSVMRQQFPLMADKSKSNMKCQPADISPSTAAYPTITKSRIKSSGMSICTVRSIPFLSPRIRMTMVMNMNMACQNNNVLGLQVDPHPVSMLAGPDPLR